MEYKYCEKQNFEDYSSGRVLYQKSGMTNFPVRLAQEIFQRSKNYISNEKKVSIFDPMCGGGYLLTVISMLNSEIIKEANASDINEWYLETAEKNLGLLSLKGLDKRIAELNELYMKYKKTSHMDAIKSTGNIIETVSGLISPIKVNVFKADVLLEKSLAGCDFKADIVITDVPYGEMVAWEGNQAQNVERLLENLKAVIHEESIVAIIADKKQKIKHMEYVRLEKSNIGKRKFEILKLKRGSNEIS